MDRAELKVIYFSDTDVIATSGFTLANIGNGINRDATLTIGGKTYTNASSTPAGTNEVNNSLEDAFNAAFGNDAFRNINFDKQNVNFSGSSALNNIIYYDSGNSGGDTAAPSLSVFNGTWYYNQTSRTFTKNKQ